MENISNILVFIFGILFLAFIFKFLWSYLVVRLFPEAVVQNLID